MRRENRCPQIRVFFYLSEIQHSCALDRCIHPSFHHFHIPDWCLWSFHAYRVQVWCIDVHSERIRLWICMKGTSTGSAHTVRATYQVQKDGSHLGWSLASEYRRDRLILWIQGDGHRSEILCTAIGRLYSVTQMHLGYYGYYEPVWGWGGQYRMRWKLGSPNLCSYLSMLIMGKVPTVSKVAETCCGSERVRGLERLTLRPPFYR